jgi:DNA-binding MarR family transcriptional regulator
MTEDGPPERPRGDRGADTRDVNEVVEEEWVGEKTPFERVYEVARRTYEAESASELADRARVSPTTARKHLRALADAGEVATTGDEGTTLYRRSETAIVTEHAQTLLAEQSPEAISAGIADMKGTIREWRAEYGVDSPEEFARELAVADADGEHGSVLAEWQTTRRNLALAQAALAIADAQRDGHLTGTDDGDGGHGGSSLPV